MHLAARLAAPMPLMQLLVVPAPEVLRAKSHEECW
eukprot:COSAG02_NODE_43938_length_370_cov_0.911439_1_plen_34_part_01